MGRMAALLRKGRNESCMDKLESLKILLACRSRNCRKYSTLRHFLFGQMVRQNAALLVSLFFSASKLDPNFFSLYWEYSTVYGCWIEDSQNNRVAYPLLRGASRSSGLADADFVKLGEYIQHMCLEVTNSKLASNHSTMENSSIISPFNSTSSKRDAHSVERTGVKESVPK